MGARSVRRELVALVTAGMAVPAHAAPATTEARLIAEVRNEIVPRDREPDAETITTG